MATKQWLPRPGRYFRLKSMKKTPKQSPLSINIKQVIWISLTIITIVISSHRHNQFRTLLRNPYVTMIDWSSDGESSEIPYNTSPTDRAFSRLELFLSTFPGNTNIEESGIINGFTELRETFIRTLEFFWPRENIRITAVIDNTAFSNDYERIQMISSFKSFFHNEVSDSVKIVINNQTNSTLYGPGWYLQQLLMLWADNFTDAEYIGFVDDDTLFTSPVNSYDLFDEAGRPRVIARSIFPEDVPGSRNWLLASEFAFKRTPRLYAMSYFPVIIKRDHLRLMRDDILSRHPQYTCFDDFYSALIHRKVRDVDIYGLAGVSQFCLMMEYTFDAHRDEYSWHFETQRSIKLATNEMYEPFPRVAIHGSYIFGNRKLRKKALKLSGRRDAVSSFMKDGYCFFLVSFNTTPNETDLKRCPYYMNEWKFNQMRLYHSGQWQFEFIPSSWLNQNSSKVDGAISKRREHMSDHVWDEQEVKNIFSF